MLKDFHYKVEIYTHRIVMVLIIKLRISCSPPHDEWTLHPSSTMGRIQSVKSYNRGRKMHMEGAMDGLGWFPQEEQFL